MTTAPPASEFETVVVAWLSRTPQDQPATPEPMCLEADRPEPRLTRFVALCALLAWLGIALVAAAAAQILGTWVWVPTDDAVVAFACFAGAAMVATLWLPGEPE